jgi:hypothetical protein
VRAGDVVKHGPTGETWVLAYADHERGEVSACGWPESIARIEDCEVINAASDAKHEEVLCAWAAKDDRGHHDHRVTVCLRQLAALEARKAAEVKR